MKQHPHNILKRITALAFVVIMLCIQAVQAFHTHSWKERTSSSNKFSSTHLTSHHHCAICDFQFAKDTDEPQDNLMVQPLRNLIFLYNHQPQQQPSQLVAGFTSRGPPAFL